MRAVPAILSGEVSVVAGDTLLLPVNYYRMALMLHLTNFINAFIFVGDPLVSTFQFRIRLLDGHTLMRRIDWGPALAQEIWIRATGGNKITYVETTNDDIFAGYLSF